MPSAPPASRPDWWYLALGLVLACGLTLRWANARTAVVHDDERHYVTDAMWATAPLGAAERLRFLRAHPHAHPRLDPETGARTPWGAGGEVARLGHPTLFALVVGTTVALAPPADADAAVRRGRVVNALADGATIPLLAALAVRVGGGPAAALLAAGLYALFPPAVTYGSLAYLDPFLAPLLVLVLLALTARRWGAAGVATGLLLATKQSGAMALVLVPLAWLAGPPRRVRNLATWGLVAGAVATALVSPGAWVDSVRRPSRPVGHVQTAPLATLAANVRAVARPSAYYWLGSAHQRPLAPLLARAHRVLTPAYLVLWAAAAATALVGRQGRRLVLLHLPVVLVLAFVLPSNGMWRVHCLSPLLCTAVACAVLEWRPAVRAVALGAAVLAGAAAAVG